MGLIFVSHYYKVAIAGCLSEVWETMIGRHVKPRNGRKRKRAVWTPLPHLLGDTRKRETGRRWDMEGQYGGKGENYEGRDVWLRKAKEAR